MGQSPRSSSVRRPYVSSANNTYLITNLLELLPKWLRRPTHLLSLKLVIREMNPFLWQDTKDVENLIQRIRYAIDFLESIREAGLSLGDASVVFELDPTAALGCQLSSWPGDHLIDFMETCKSLEDALLNFPRGKTVAYNPAVRRDRASTAPFWYPSAFPRLANRDLLSSTDTNRTMRIVLEMKPGSFGDVKFMTFRNWSHESDNDRKIIRCLSDFMGWHPVRRSILDSLFDGTFY